MQKAKLGCNKPRLKLVASIAKPLCCAFGAVYSQLLHLQSPQKVERETENNKENDSENQGLDEDLELAIFALATHSFSMDNKPGEGGFGPVYKGLEKTM
ncbi:Uncharacterized protein TCM_031212 [Theobroma cacao]|uniref:Uncharacterized protein n=1 Tax=Theobroma cacao TaxID=3641 RepID=A0A061F7Q5_THECC|nr:Uncharacterized protein TCM_031212 [Theobroma cacao]